MMRQQEFASLYFQKLSGICYFQGAIWILTLGSLDTPSALFAGLVNALYTHRHWPLDWGSSSSQVPTENLS